MRLSPAKIILRVALAGCALLGCLQQLRSQNIELEIRDRDSRVGTSARLRFTKGEKQAGLPRNLLKVGKWTLAESNIPIAPKPGEYEFLAQRGHEFNEIRGGFSIEKGARDVVSVELPRSTNMRQEGWYSGDHFSSLRAELLQRWQQADAIDLVVSSSQEPADQSDSTLKSNTRPKRKAESNSTLESAGELELGSRLSTTSLRWESLSGTVLFHPIDESESLGTDKPKGLVQAMELLSDYDRVKNHVPELEQLWTQDVPILLSSNQIKAAQILNFANTPDGDAKLEIKPNLDPRSTIRLSGKMIRQGMPNEIFAPIPEEDRIRYRDGRGIGMLSEKIFWSILETGLRITPTASSGFGEGDTYLGYNRTYAHCDEELTESRYWQSVALGHTMVTNGPLLRVTINDQFPGSTQSSRTGEPIELNIAASLSVRDPVDYLDVVFNGETLYSAKLEDHYRKGEFPPISIDKSGWLIVRVVTSHDHLYRLATTAPFYFEFDGKPRISAKSVEFMMNWLKRSSESILKQNQSDSNLQSTLDAAERFWQDRLEQANAP